MVLRGAPLPSNITAPVVVEVVVVFAADDDSEVVSSWFDFLRSSTPPPLLLPRMLGGNLDVGIAVNEGLAKYMVVQENAKAAKSSAVNSLSPRMEEPNFFTLPIILTTPQVLSNVSARESKFVKCE